MKKGIVNIVLISLLLGHCVHRRMTTTPTRADAITDAKNVRQLQEVYNFTRDRATKLHIKQQIDSINRISNKYKN